jgi:acetolactate synthase small subunit
MHFPFQWLSFHFSALKYLISSLCYNLQIMWLVDIFRAKIVDISEDSLTIEVNFVRSLACTCVF